MPRPPITYCHQVPGLGTARELDADKIDHVIVLLRVIEQLPLLSDTDLFVTENVPSYDELKRCIESIHATHLDLAAMASSVLIDNDSIG